MERMKATRTFRLPAVVTCLSLLLTEASASGGRRLTSTGDKLGTYYKPPPPPAPPAETLFIKSREIQDHAHFYAAAEVLSLWAQTTFALSAEAHYQLTAQPKGPLRSSCVYDGKQCLLNPTVMAAKGFPSPKLPAELVLKRFALEAYMCRSARVRADCHLDSNCDWDDLTGACFLAHDPHSDFTAAIMPCRDMLYTAVTAACWRREPSADSEKPCGYGACRLFKAGSGASWKDDVSGGSAGLPEDRCLPDLYRGSWGGPATISGPPTGPRLKPLDVYALLKRYFGSGKLSAEALANATTVLPDLAVWEEAGGGADKGSGQGGEVPLLAGFGNCSTAVLHHAMKTSCRYWHEGPCTQDSRCSWQAGITSTAHCVLGRNTVIELLLGSSDFTQAVRKAEAACQSAPSSEACLDVALGI